MTPPPQTPFERLRAVLLPRERIAVALSGGLDSSVLLAAAAKVLGPEHCLALTAQTPYVMEEEVRDSAELCRRLGIRQETLAFPILPSLADNPPLRCYLCKHESFENTIALAKENGVLYVAEGSNMDDNGDYRPGLQAVAELGVKSPLRHSELYKEDIRALSKDLDLPTWEKQSFACLSSRFVYGETITKEKLGMVDKAEQLLLDLGFHQLRVRIHGTLARIEVLPDELQKVLENRNQIVKAFKEYGFTYVTMDLQGYRMGSMNETLKK